MAAAALRSCAHICSCPVVATVRPRRGAFQSVAVVKAGQVLPVITSSSKSAQAQALWSWLRENGVGSGAAKPAPVAEGLGLVAEKEVAEGDEVVAVPSGLWINAATARASEQIGRLCEGRKLWIAIALFLLHEKSKPDSKWRPYVDALPDILDSPLFWSDEELSELQGTYLIESTLGYRQYVESEYNKLMEESGSSISRVFQPNTFTLEALMWAFGILRSRTFAPLTGDDLALVPFADLVNHDSGLAERASWEKKSAGLFFSQQSVLVVRAGSSCRAGEQILVQYGKDKSNSELALDYGFVERSKVVNGIPGSGREKISLTLEIPASDRFLDDKLDICQINKYESTAYFDLLLGEAPPEDMLRFLRLIVMDGTDAFHLEALFRDDVWEHLQFPISRENEEAMCRTMLDGCAAALSGYSTSIEADVDLLNGGKLSSRMEIAIVVRLDEKRVLRDLQTWFEERMTGLDKLEYYAERRLRDLGLVDDRGNDTPWVFND